MKFYSRCVRMSVYCIMCMWKKIWQFSVMICDDCIFLLPFFYVDYMEEMSLSLTISCTSFDNALNLIVIVIYNFSLSFYSRDKI